MKKIERYLLQEFLRVFSLAFLASLSLYLVVDFFERINMLISNEAGLRVSLLFFLYKIPIIITQITPVALLLAIIISLGSLHRRNEINAIRSSGIRNIYLFKPFLAVGITISLLLLFFSETIVPLSNFKMDYIKNIEIKKQKPGSFGSKEIWYRDANSIFHIESISPDRKQLQGIHIWNLSPEFAIRYRIDSREASWSEKRWQTASAITRRSDSALSPGPQIEIKQNAFLPIPQAPEDFALVILNPEEMSYFKLKNYIQQLKKAGQEIQPLLVDLHAKISIPFLALIVTFIGFPLGLRFGKQGGVLVGIFASLIAGFAFWIILALGLSLGHAGSLPPFLGAWISHVIFAVGGIFLMKDERL